MLLTVRGLGWVRMVLVAALGLGASLVVGAQTPAPQVVVEQVGEGIYAVLQPQASRFNDSNTLFVVGSTGVTVVDTQATPASTARAIAAIRSRTELPVRELVLTHWHGDHVQSVETYRRHWPALDVIAHRSVRDDLAARAQPALIEDRERYRKALTDARERLSEGVDREGDPLDSDDRDTLAATVERWQRHLDGLEAIALPLVLPELAYSESMLIDRDGRTIELLHVRAHTRGDTLVWIDDAGVLATGDVLDDLPFGGHGFPTSWLAALERIEALGPAVIVPGHGRLRQGSEHLVRVRRLLQAILAQVERAADGGLDLEQTQASVSLESFEKVLVGKDALAQRHWNAFIPAMVERAWREQRGELDRDDPSPQS